MRYKIFDLSTNQFIDNEDNEIILKQDGWLDYREDSEYLICSSTFNDCVPLFFPTANEHYYIDEIGGIHKDGLGWNPEGSSCGECSCVTCSQCTKE